MCLGRGGSRPGFICSVIKREERKETEREKTGRKRENERKRKENERKKGRKEGKDLVLTLEEGGHKARGSPDNTHTL